MYINYLHDTEAQLIDTASRSIEGDQTHLRIQRGTVSVNLTANQQGNQNVNFNQQFTPNSMVYVYLTPTSVTLASKLNYQPASVTPIGFQLQAYSDTAQTATFNYLAIGKEE